MSISIRQIEAFRAVMICRTTTAAAEFMHVTQPVISKLISQLEFKLGYPLFERTGNAIVPNDHARRLFDEALQVQEKVDQFTRLAQALASPDTGMLTVYASATLSTTLVPRVMKDFRAKAPNVRIRIENSNVQDIAQKLSVDPYSVGVTIWPVESPVIECHVLALRPVQILLPFKHRLTSKAGDLLFDDLKNENLILHSASMPLGDAIRAKMAQYEHGWSVPFTVDSSETAYSLVEQGLGVFMCDAFGSTSLNARNLAVREIKSGIHTSVCLLRSRFAPSRKHVELFATMLRAHIENSSSL